jgi:hypothetical protein
MSIVGELDKALRGAGIPIDGASIARLDSTSLLKSWMAAKEHVDAAAHLKAWTDANIVTEFGGTYRGELDGEQRELSFEDRDEIGRRVRHYQQIVDTPSELSSDADEIAERIAYYQAMVADPDTRPWDRTRWRVDFKAEATDEQKAQAQQILDSFDPDAVKEPVLRSWPVALSRLTPEEFGRLRDARRDDLRVDLLYARAMAQPAGMLDMNDPEVVGGFALLVSLKVFDQARLDELFA